MNNPPEETNPTPGQTWISAILPILGGLFILSAFYAFFTVGWIIGLSLLAVSAVLFSLGAILDLLLEIFRSLRRLESSAAKKSDKT